MEPEQLGRMALAIQPGTILANQVTTGAFIQATPRQLLEEERYLLENLEDFDTIYRGNHSNNMVSSRSRLPVSREMYPGKVEHAIAHYPVTEQEVLLTSSW